jgi:hypothetical protein
MSVDVTARIELDAVQSRTAIRVAAAAPAREEVGEQTESVLRGLCRLMSLGAFRPAHDTRAAVIPLSGVGSSQWMLFDLTCPAVHPSVWRVITGAIAARGASAVALESGTTARTAGWADLLRIPRYQSGRTPFDVRASHNPNRAERIVQISFRTPVTAGLMRSVESILDDWDGLLAGGFPIAGSLPGEMAALGLGTYAVDPLTIEHRISDDDHDDEAYEVLLDVFGHVHGAIAPIEYVAID